jgi:hypothetical protein
LTGTIRNHVTVCRLAEVIREPGFYGIPRLGKVA